MNKGGENAAHESKGGINMMYYECRAMYSNSPNGVYHIDEECSTKKRPISNEDAETYMKMLETMGCKRHENSTQIFYDQTIDARHGTEYIFYKNVCN